MNKSQRTAFEILAAMPKWQRDYADWCIDEKTKKESEKVEKLPTKKEVMERLQKVCDAINGEPWCKLHARVESNDTVPVSGKKAWVRIYDAGVSCASITSQYTGYREAPKPPERLEVVLVRNCRDETTIVGVSKGSFDKDGDLQCYHIIDTLDDNVGWAHWRWIATGEHSEGWRDEWTPEEFRR